METEMQQEDVMVPKEWEDHHRKWFARKVYAILCMQLGLTSLIVGVVVAVDKINEWLSINWPFMLCLSLINVIVLITLLCFKKTARRHPTNLILLGIFTVSEGLLVGNFAAFFDPLTVLFAAVLALSVTLGITAYSFYENTDFAPIRGMGFGMIIGLILWSIFFGLYYDTMMVNLIICLVFILIYTIFIVMDTRMIVGGGRWSLSYDDYIIGSLCLYIDIIGLFIYILSLLGGKK